MMYCKNCGKELLDNTQYCPYCGTKQDAAVEVTKVKGPDAPNQDKNTNKTSTSKVLAILGIILGVCCFGVVGLILSIVGYANAKTKEDKTLCLVGIIVSAIFTVLYGTGFRFIFRF